MHQALPVWGIMRWMSLVHGIDAMQDVLGWSQVREYGGLGCSSDQTQFSQPLQYNWQLMMHAIGKRAKTTYHDVASRLQYMQHIRKTPNAFQPQSWCWTKDYEKKVPRYHFQAPPSLSSSCTHH